MFSLFDRKVSLSASGLFGKMTDRHSHLLFGVDDGSPDLAHSLKILSLMEKEGLRDLWLTPHIMEDCPNTTMSLRSVFTQLSEAYKGSVRLHLAAEYMIDNLYVERLVEGDLLTMDDNSVLIETSTWSSPYDMMGIIGQTVGSGYKPVLAHPERYRYMDMRDYEKLVSDGVRLQLNLPSLTGAYGPSVETKARELLSAGMYWWIGTDCHSYPSLENMLFSKKISSSEMNSLLKLAEN